ncbi:hypothetical protein BC939DRAFT_451052 [Gamsiella multidivaricata]|uniref:uncharacterized protein n=1 Tax=Gamsiella multidivaricata TaxID=101098 RepID=UPI00221FB926|nr:uncharacterized protein BC939DRAFT_451052 [Gamsiella multidivaricata]KAI7823852.1 hypothetical protein BC939DRAFT_451052 [Gamsiella multidivaricata]
MSVLVASLATVTITTVMSRAGGTMSVSVPFPFSVSVASFSSVATASTIRSIMTLIVALCRAAHRIGKLFREL